MYVCMYVCIAIELQQVTNTNSAYHYPKNCRPQSLIDENKVSPKKIKNSSWPSQKQGETHSQTIRDRG